MLRCLIIDDSPTFIRAARAHLEREGVVVVGVALTSGDALRLVDDVHPDVILLDVHLADESGFELASRLAREHRVDPAQMILISTHSREDFGDLVTGAPVAGFLSKSELSLARIQSLLGGLR
jgi:DNA-binding NarL/FixJ family response regulator